MLGPVSANEALAEAWRAEFRNPKMIEFGTTALTPYVREIQEVCPDAARTSWNIFLAIHKVAFTGNFICGYHSLHTLTKPEEHVDDHTKSKWSILGQATVLKKLTRQENSEVDAAVIRVFHCGCNTREVALDYFVWKCWPIWITRIVGGITSREIDGTVLRIPHPPPDPHNPVKRVTGEIRSVTEAMGSGRLDPRTRAFFCAALNARGITIDNIYMRKSSSNENRTAHELLLLRAQMAVLKARITELGGDDEESESDSDSNSDSDSDSASGSGSDSSLRSSIYIRQVTTSVTSCNYCLKMCDGVNSLQRALKECSRSILQPPFHFVKKGPGSEGNDVDMFYAQALPDQYSGIVFVNEWLPTAWKKKAELIAKVAALERELEMANLDVLLASEMIEENESIAATRKRLPTEILLEIFSWAVSSGSRLRRFRKALRVSHVCRAWRDIALDEAGLWTDFELPQKRAKGWGRSSAEGSLVYLDALKTCLARSRQRSLNVVLSADDGLEDGMLELLLAEVERWGSLELRSPELISIPDIDSMRLQHDWVDGFEPIKGCLSALRVLKIKAHGRRGTWGKICGDSLWQGDWPEERDKLHWFENAPNLRKVVLDAVCSPEETLLIAWDQVETYREDFTERPGTLPLEHLGKMHRLVDLHLTDVWLPNAERSDRTTLLLELPNLTCFRMDLSHRSKPGDLPPYDRLSALVLPALKKLQLEGEEFECQRDENQYHSFLVDHSILSMLRRSPAVSQALSHLTLWLSTGLTAEMAISLLTQIPTLRTFAVKQRSMSAEGIMTDVFLSKFTQVPLLLEALTIHGGVGNPQDSRGMVIRAEPWMDLFITMLDFQFDRNLVEMNIIPSPHFSHYCPFRATEHLRLEDFVGRWPKKRFLWHDHRFGLECRSRWKMEDDMNAWDDTAKGHAREADDEEEDEEREERDDDEEGEEGDDDEEGEERGDEEEGEEQGVHADDDDQNQSTSKEWHWRKSLDREFLPLNAPVAVGPSEIWNVQRRGTGATAFWIVAPAVGQWISREYTTGVILTTMPPILSARDRAKQGTADGRLTRYLVRQQDLARCQRKSRSVIRSYIEVGTGLILGAMVCGTDLLQGERRPPSVDHEDEDVCFEIEDFTVWRPMIYLSGNQGGQGARSERIRIHIFRHWHGVHTGESGTAHDSWRGTRKKGVCVEKRRGEKASRGACRNTCGKRRCRKAAIGASRNGCASWKQLAQAGTAAGNGARGGSQKRVRTARAGMAARNATCDASCEGCDDATQCVEASARLELVLKGQKRYSPPRFATSWLGSLTEDSSQATTASEAGERRGQGGGLRPTSPNGIRNEIKVPVAVFDAS
ncbi:hypothetical protein DFH09DRAFT_1112541 [Mycena vulgaris]|nr:hypothetical protein DFH09DRAFT_1112541 [Mycena vulgaris]